MAPLNRILLTGDVHGNTDWVIHHVLPQAKRHGCQLVLQLGDFGIWPGPEGRRYLSALSRQAKGVRIPIWFIDGNHEDFDQLDALPLDDQGRRPVQDHITHLPRGYRWEWAGRTLLACGGASSIDVADRLPGRSWWPQETITDHDVARCSEGGRVDILLTHDIQAEVPLTDPMLAPVLPPSVADALSHNRQQLQRITEAVKPKLQIHGHWHLPYDWTMTRSSDNEEVRIVSLNCDPSFALTADHHCAVLDLDVLALSVSHAVQVID
jgi:predicted phosphodiesterase